MENMDSSMLLHHKRWRYIFATKKTMVTNLYEHYKWYVWYTKECPLIATIDTNIIHTVNVLLFWYTGTFYMAPQQILVICNPIQITLTGSSSLWQMRQRSTSISLSIFSSSSLELASFTWSMNRFGLVGRVFCLGATLGYGVTIKWGSYSST